MDDTLLIQENYPDKDYPEKSNITLPKRKKPVSTSKLIIAVILLVAGTILFYKIGIFFGTNALEKSFNETEKSESDEVYNEYYEDAYKKAYNNYYLANNVEISIGDIKETQNLQVLKANDVEFITENKNDDSDKVTSWLEVEGEGTFFVDLSAAEFNIDNKRRYILVRVPKPKLKDIKINKATEILFDSKNGKGSFREGVNLAIYQINEAQEQIERALQENMYVHKMAENAAKSKIQNLVTKFNPNIPNVIVEVEFMQ